MNDDRNLLKGTIKGSAEWRDDPQRLRRQQLVRGLLIAVSLIAAGLVIAGHLG